MEEQFFEHLVNLLIFICGTLQLVSRTCIGLELLELNCLTNLCILKLTCPSGVSKQTFSVSTLNGSSNDQFIVSFRH